MPLIPPQFVDMENREVTLDDGSITQTCTAAMGYSMWAGPVDGPTGQMPQVSKVGEVDGNSDAEWLI